MKKIIALILVLVVTLSVAIFLGSCDTEGDKGEQSESNVTGTQEKQGESDITDEQEDSGENNDTEQSVPCADGHTEVVDAAVAPTCTAEGKTEGKHCSVCNTVLIAQKNVAMEAHDVGTDGYCKICGNSIVGTEGVEYALSSDGTYARVVGYKGNSARVIIADKYEGVPVTRIGEAVFYSCTSLTSIAIPDSVTDIGSGAFRGCTNLTSIAIPDSVTSLGEKAFYGCKSLTSVTIGNGVISIGERAFFNCTSLTSITIPESITSIGELAFYNCTSLASITIHGNVTSIGEYVFYGCTSLASIIIPDNVTSIDEYAFYVCKSLTSVTIPNSVTRISYSSFSGCTNLMSIIFNGTKEQWNAIDKGSYWNDQTSDYTIYCTDGNITK